ncbi:hypothetical protein Ccrd_003399 [Cynara cardunculus var. scolymus]|uniref:Uncharacterized protein n=1 Tax=Cynara cardunculus var. scolymus TaxID=59895 RepID=A0A103XPF3_CYNCS|nr:hypothetical protein Ccrd_003399 [Cynara cardunculus var. scolymus]
MTMNSISFKCYHLPSSIKGSNDSFSFDSSKSIIRFNFVNPNRRRISYENTISRSSVVCSSSDDAAASGSVPSGDNIPSNFCIIEGPETVQDFVKMQSKEIQDNIRSRRNKIFLLMEEVRRLRVQQRLKNIKLNESSSEDNEMPDIPSSIPFLPSVTPKTLKQLYLTSFSFISGIIVFGGLLAPIVDPIVASFSGGAVGVISTLMLLEANNVMQQEKKSGVCLNIEPISVSNASDRPLRAPTTRRCLSCSGAGKVMCPTCLCTGMVMASEHDHRIDPFD